MDGYQEEGGIPILLESIKSNYNLLIFLLENNLNH